MAIVCCKFQFLPMGQKLTCTCVSGHSWRLMANTLVSDKVCTMYIDGYQPHLPNSGRFHQISSQRLSFPPYFPFSPSPSFPPSIPTSLPSLFSLHTQHDDGKLNACNNTEKMLGSELTTYMTLYICTKCTLIGGGRERALHEKKYSSLSLKETDSVSFTVACTCTTEPQTIMMGV